MIKSGCLSIALNATALLLLESGIRIASAETITLTLSNGDKIQGKLVKSESTDTVTVIDHPSLGKLKIQSTALKAKPKKKRWTGSFSAGITGSNTDRDQDLDSTSQLITQYKDEVNLFSFKANTEYGFSKSAGEQKGLLTQTKDN